jgi:hypothetical protein
VPSMGAKVCARLQVARATHEDVVCAASMETTGYARCKVAPPTQRHAVSVASMEAEGCAPCQAANHGGPCVGAVPCGSVFCFAAAAAGACFAEGRGHTQLVATRNF